MDHYQQMRQAASTRNPTIQVAVPVIHEGERTLYTVALHPSPNWGPLLDDKPAMQSLLALICCNAAYQHALEDHGATPCPTHRGDTGS